MTVMDNHPSKDKLVFPGISESSRPIVRTDGRSFRLISAERPVCYPAEKPTGRPGISSIGFWYSHKPNGQLTQSVVVILRHPPKQLTDIKRQVEIIADRLAEQLAKDSRLSATYEFDGSRSLLKAY